MMITRTLRLSITALALTFLGSTLPAVAQTADPAPAPKSYRYLEYPAKHREEVGRQLRALHVLEVVHTMGKRWDLFGRSRSKSLVEADAASLDKLVETLGSKVTHSENVDQLTINLHFYTEYWGSGISQWLNDDKAFALGVGTPNDKIPFETLVALAGDLHADPFQAVKKAINDKLLTSSAYGTFNVQGVAWSISLPYADEPMQSGQASVGFTRYDKSYPQANERK